MTSRSNGYCWCSTLKQRIIINLENNATRALKSPLYALFLKEMIYYYNLIQNVTFVFIYCQMNL